MSGLYLKLGAAVLAVVLLAGIALSIYNKGKTAGRVEGAADQLQQDRAQFEQDRATFLAELAKYKEQDDAAKTAIAVKDHELSVLRAGREATRRQVQSLPADQVITDIQKRLDGNIQPQLSEVQLRHMDEMLADYSNLDAQVTALEAKSAEQDKRISAIEHQRDAAITAYNNLAPLYVKAWNATQKKHSLLAKILTFGILRDKKIDLPSPVSLGIENVPAHTGKTTD